MFKTHWLIGFIFFFFPNGLLAQYKVQVGWTNETDLPKSNTLYYQQRSVLAWSDFKGKAQYEGRTAALTVSGFGYKASMGYTGTQGSLDIKLFCYFDQAKSWARPDKKSDYVLNHEQRHFDLSFIAAARFRMQLMQTKFAPDNSNQVLQKIYEEAQAELTRLQQTYDDETQNGLNREQQDAWNQKIDDWLSNLKQ